MRRLTHALTHALIHALTHSLMHARTPALAHCTRIGAGTKINGSSQSMHTDMCTHLGILKQLGGAGVEFGFPNIKMIRQVNTPLVMVCDLVYLYISYLHPGHNCHKPIETKKEALRVQRTSAGQVQGCRVRCTLGLGLDCGEQLLCDLLSYYAGRWPMHTYTHHSPPRNVVHFSAESSRTKFACRQRWISGRRPPPCDHAKNWSVCVLTVLF